MSVCLARGRYFLKKERERQRHIMRWGALVVSVHWLYVAAVAVVTHVRVPEHAMGHYVDTKKKYDK